MWVNLQHQRWEQGGSTLTQQLAKNVFLSTERTADRKLREAFLSLALEHRLSKDDILALYLNEIYLGQAGSSSLCGMDAAARAWFGKPIERVDTAEAATLAGVIASPNAWSPLRHPEEAQKRRDVVLDRMAEVGWLTTAERDAAKAKALVLHPALTARQAPWVVDEAIDTVEEKAGAGAVARQGLDVYTTISPLLQSLAERAVDEGVAEITAAHPKLAGVQAAMVVVRVSDGAVVAMVGWRDYATSNFNRAKLATRQVGSTVKALTMLVGFEADPDLSPATRFTDAPISRTHDGKLWTPANYDNTFLGPVSLRHAVQTSRNIPAVLLAEHIGLGTLKDRLMALGLDNATDYPSVALGGFGATPLQLAAAYATLGDGTYHPPVLTQAALTRDGDHAWDAPDAPRGPHYSSASRWLAYDVLRGVLTDGTGKAAGKYGVGPGAAGKSGTTDGYVDAWFAGLTGNYAVVSWVGFDQNQPVGLTGGAAALPIWARFVAWSGTSNTVPKPPEGVVEADVCVATDRPPCPGCDATRLEWFKVGHVPEAECGVLPQVGAAAESGLKWLGRLFSKDPEAAGDGKAGDGKAGDGKPGDPDPADDEVRIRPRKKPAADRIGPDGSPVPE
jgi:penicillin-binding protein 1B